MSALYLVATPIGNLEDITLRALRVLREVPLVAAEDTRRARVLFARHGITTPLVSYHEQGGRSKLAELLRRLETTDVALITEAGTPSISDPGYALVREALARGVRVEAVPGPSAVTTALAVSGLPPDQFTFTGFLPRSPGERRRLLAALAREPRTIVVFEAPHRLRAALQDIGAAFGDRPLAVCRELTKLHEEVFRGAAAQALDHFQQPRGEFTLVLAGASAQSQPQDADEKQVRRRLQALRDSGATARDAVSAIVRETGLPKRQVYRWWVETGR